MLDNKCMTKREARLRDNHLRWEKFKKIKAENGEAYRNHLKTNRERGTRRRKRLKEDPATHQRELARGRRDRKQYRDRIRKNKKAYRQQNFNSLFCKYFFRIFFSLVRSLINSFCLEITRVLCGLSVLFSDNCFRFSDICSFVILFFLNPCCINRVLI